VNDEKKLNARFFKQQTKTKAHLPDALEILGRQFSLFNENTNDVLDATNVGGLMQLSPADETGKRRMAE
jgi:hypothetical protein